MSNEHPFFAFKKNVFVLLKVVGAQLKKIIQYGVNKYFTRWGGKHALIYEKLFEQILVDIEKG